MAMANNFLWNAADVATAISESMIRTAASGPVTLAIAAAGR